MAVKFIYTGLYNLKTIRFLDFAVHITPNLFVKHQHSKTQHMYMMNFGHTASPVRPVFTQRFLTNDRDDYESTLLERSAGLLESFKGKNSYTIPQLFGFIKTGEAYIKVEDYYYLNSSELSFDKQLFKNMFADIVEAFLEIRNLDEIYDEDFLTDKLSTAHKTLRWLTDQPMTKEEYDEVVGVPLNSFEAEIMDKYIDEYATHSLSFTINSKKLEEVQNKVTKLLSREAE